MAARPSSAARSKARQAAGELKDLVKAIGKQARAVAEKHGATKSVTIIRGVTTSKDRPTRIKVR